MSDDRALPDVAAAELALGVLDGEERAAALRRVLAEPAFAAEVERWRGHLSQLFGVWPEMAPPADMFARIEQSIDGLPVPAVPGRSRVWQIVAGMMTVAAAVLLVLLVARPAPQPTVKAIPQELLVVAITPSAEGKTVSAVYEPASAALRLSEAGPVATGRDAELWVIGGDGVPHALGLLQPGSRTALTVAAPDRARIAPGAKLAISVEPKGGSKTGAPTGPIVATGTITAA